MIIRLTLLSALTLTGLAPASSAHTETTPPDPSASIKQAPPLQRPAKSNRVEYEPTTVLVKFRGSKSTVAKALRARGAQSLGPIAGTGFITVRSTAPAPQLLASLRKDKAVVDASLDYRRHIAATPNDEFYNLTQAAYFNTLRIPSAWNYVRDTSRQVIAVLDTGVNWRHEDLVGRTVPGYNSVRPGAAPADDNGHGTFVAGVAAANTNNRLGLAGVAWNGRIMPVKVLDSQGGGSDSVIARGIIWAADHGARVVNLSLGGPGHSAVLLEAVRYALRKGAVVVAAAGNTGSNDAEFPAAYPEVLAVGATDHAGALTDFSTWGDWVDLSAPGFNIASTGRDGNYYRGLAGTSFSAPIVSGIAALTRARFPTLTPSQIMVRLKLTARDAGPRGIDPYHGFGFVDAFQAIGGPWAHEFGNLSLGAGEPNDMPDRATPVTTSVTGTAAIEGDVDWYRYDAAAGQVAIRVTPPTNSLDRPQNLDPILAVYDSELRLLGTSDDPEDPGAVESLFMNLSAGRHYIAVSNFNGSRDARLYTLGITSEPGVVHLPGDAVWVRNVQPADFAGLVPLTVKPAVTFHRALDPASVTTSTVRLVQGKSYASVPGTVTYDEATKTATITPAAPLQDNTPYRIIVGAVREPGSPTGNTTPVSTTFRTVNTAPGPVTGFDAVGSSPGAVRLGWRLPYITDLDQVVVRRAAGTTPPSSPTAGTAVPVTSSSGTIATGLTNGTSYAFSAWVRDRTGLYSPAAKTLMVGTRVGSAAAPTVVTYGQVVKLSAGLARVDTGAAVAGHSIFLHSRQHGTRTWQLVGRFTTNASGIATFSYKPSVGRDYIWTYYGSVDLVGSQSGIRAILVRPVITSNVSKPSVGLGGSVLFYGSVNPKHVGQLVFLQRWVGRWAHVTTTRLTSNSTYVFSIKPAVRGTYAYRAVRPADADHLVAISPTRTFRVT